MTAGSSIKSSPPKGQPDTLTPAPICIRSGTKQPKSPPGLFNSAQSPRNNSLVLKIPHMLPYYTWDQVNTPRSSISEELTLT